MLLWLAASIALAGPGKWADRNADVSATATVHAPPAVIRKVLTDPHVLEHLYPSSCATDYDYDEPKDPKATVCLIYTAGPMHRRLDAMAPEGKGPTVVQVEHLGNKGFVTRWTLTPEDDATEVQMSTYLQPPPWPFRRIFYTRVRPAWVQCHVEALQQLENLAHKPDASG